MLLYIKAFYTKYHIQKTRCWQYILHTEFFIHSPNKKEFANNQNGPKHFYSCRLNFIASRWAADHLLIDK